MNAYKKRGRQGLTSVCRAHLKGEAKPYISMQSSFEGGGKALHQYAELI